MKIAIVITAKNEERLLKSNLQYHFAVGVNKAYIYFDGATDGGPDSIRDIPQVEVQDSVNPETYSHLSFLDKFTTMADEHHTARQCLNTYNATLKCKRDGIDWLISIDADEVIIADKNEPAPLTTLFDGVSEDVDLIHFNTKEAVQRRNEYDNVFADETLFKSTHLFKRKLERPSKEIHDPFLKKNTKISYWMGQFQGKSAIRVASDLIPKNVHRYKHKDGSLLKQIEKGLVLHYHAFDQPDFIKKFTNFKKHPDNFLAGSDVGYVKKLWRDVVNSDDIEAHYRNNYFQNNIMFTESEINKMSSKIFGILPRKQKPFEKITSVKKAFDSLNLQE
ncbi:MAG: glycosyltransferase family 2 protein [Nonlabens sp.]